MRFTSLRTCTVVSALFYLCGLSLSISAQVVIPVTRDAQGNMQLGNDGEIAITTIDEMQARLVVATDEQAANLLERLGLEAEVAREAAVESHGARQIKIEVEPSDERSQPPAHESAILFAPSTVQGAASISLLSRRNLGEKVSAWHDTDHLLIPGFAHPVSYEWLSLKGIAGPMVLIHHENVDHGSNELEDCTGLYALRRGKFIRQLHTIDYSSHLHWKPGAATDQSQVLVRQSSFLPFPDGSLEETRVSSLDSRQIEVERRYWSRKPGADEFEAGPFAQAQAR